MSLSEATVRFMKMAMEHEIGDFQRDTDNKRKAYEVCVEKETDAIKALEQLMDLYPYLKNKPDEEEIHAEQKFDPTVAVAIPMVAQPEPTKNLKKLKETKESKNLKESTKSKETEESTKQMANYSTVADRAAKANGSFAFPKNHNKNVKNVAAPRDEAPEDFTPELKALLDLIKSVNSCKFGQNCKKLDCTFVHPDHWYEAYKYNSSNFRIDMLDDTKRGTPYNFARTEVESQLRTAAMLKGYNPKMDNWNEWVAEVSRFFHGIA
jgi:hypothetical protein